MAYCINVGRTSDFTAELNVLKSRESNMDLYHLNISIGKPFMLRDFPLGKPIIAVFNRAGIRGGQEGQRGK